jgi:hypothetical protein
VAITKQKYQAAAGDPVRAQVRRLLNDVGLRAPQFFEQPHSLIKEFQGSLRFIAGRRPSTCPLTHGSSPCTQDPCTDLPVSLGISAT